MIRAIANYLMGEIPLWFIGLVTACLPENVFTCRLRGTLSRPFFKSCGKRFQYGARVRFLHPQKMEIGNSVYIAADGWINAKGGLVLEDGVTIGPRCGLVTTFHRFADCRVTYGMGTGGDSPIRIGAGTWLAMGVVVVHGVTVGQGCIVTANSVVTKATPNHAMIGGIPAKLIKLLESSKLPPPG